MPGNAQPEVRPPLRVLIVGPLPPPIGGTSVLLLHLAESLQARGDVEPVVVDTTGVRGHPIKAPVRLARLIWRIVGGVRRCDVATLHVSLTGLPLMGPIVCAVTLAFGKPLLVRKFGGRDYPDLDPLRRALSRWVVRHARLYLLETKEQIRAAQERGIKHVEWYSNSRPLPEATEPSSQDARSCRRFVFISHVKLTKGVAEIIAAGERLAEDLTIDVYGPFFGDLSEASFQGLQRVRYRGVVPPTEVMDTLRRYDALLLPTFYDGEGYPGIIVEAYAAGLPVITTRWKSIPEIVDDTCGLLIEPRSADALYEAMKALVDDDALYARLRDGARAKRDFFDARRWTDRFVELCEFLHRGGQARGSKRGPG